MVCYKNIIFNGIKNGILWYWKFEKCGYNAKKLFQQKCRKFATNGLKCLQITKTWITGQLIIIMNEQTWYEYIASVIVLIVILKMIYE